MVERLVREAMAEGQIPADRDPAIETDLILALTGFTPLLELEVIEPQAALAAIDRQLDRLFATTSSRPRVSARPDLESHG